MTILTAAFARLPAARLAAVAVASVLLVAASGCSDDTDASHADDGTAATTAVESAVPDAIEQGPEGDALFVPPDPLPAGAPGQIVWARAFPAIEDTIGYRLLFHSTSVNGEDIAVSGTILVPEGDPPQGGRPVAVIGQSRGAIADDCAASRDPSYERDHDDVGHWSERDLAHLMARQGYVVAIPDYQGFGTPGPGRFLEGEAEAHAVLDGARAARLLAGTPDAPVVGMGNSQGGHAMAFAAELAQSYAPDLDLSGVFIGHPLAELATIGGPMGSSPIFGQYLLAYAGLLPDNPALADSDALTPQGEATLDRFEDECGEDVVADLETENPATYITDPATLPPDFVDVLDANSPGNQMTDIPILVVHGDDAEPIPQLISDLFFARLCDTGTTAEYRKPAGTADEAVAATEPYLVAWMTDRIAGETAPTTPCP
jgi:Secretory lipase